MKESEKVAIRTGINLLKASTVRDFSTKGTTIEQDWIAHAKKMETTIDVCIKLMAPFVAFPATDDG